MKKQICYMCGRSVVLLANDREQVVPRQANAAELKSYSGQ